jgi:hypothetical protein
VVGGGQVTAAETASGQPDPARDGRSMRASNGKRRMATQAVRRSPERSVGSSRGGLGRRPLEPSTTQLHEGVLMQHPLEQGKYTPFFEAKMLTGREQGRLQQTPGFGASARSVNLLESVINLAMVLVHSLQASLVFQDMVQRQIGEVRFGFRMPLQQALDDARHVSHLGRGGEAGQHTFDLIKHAQIDVMLSNQGFSYFHSR